MTVGEKLRCMRLMSNKTLKEQSVAFNVSLNTVCRWEHGLASPRKSRMSQIADHYDIPLKWLSQESDEGYMSVLASEAEAPENELERQLLRMFRKLTNSGRYEAMSLIERIYREGTDDGDTVL